MNHLNHTKDITNIIFSYLTINKLQVITLNKINLKKIILLHNYIKWNKNYTIFEIIKDKYFIDYLFDEYGAYM